MKKINIAELLEDCPKGMELDCTICNNVVTLEGVNTEGDYPIIVATKNRFHHILTCEGCVYPEDDAKCVIFPKGKTTWEGFVPPCKFKDGDILVHGDCTFIYNGFENNMNYGTYVIIDCDGAFAVNALTKKYGTRFATEEEKAKLFKAIKGNGYRWNAETKTLEKLVKPKFKVGDVIVNIYRKHLNSDSSGWKIYQIENDKYIFTDGSYIHIQDQNNWELVPNKFDINTLVPFEDKVLIRNDESQRWLPAFWGYKVVDGFITTFGWCKYCIPYKRNEILFKTNNDCDDFYKTWEK